MIERDDFAKRGEIIALEKSGVKKASHAKPSPNPLPKGEGNKKT
jgi:hypothetical protein